MQEVYTDFDRLYAPKQTIRRLIHLTTLPLVEGSLRDALSGALKQTGLWRCLTCDICTKVCPQDIRFRDFAETMRSVALDVGESEGWSFCPICEKPYLPEEILSRLEAYVGDSRHMDLLHICPKCRPRYQGEKVMEILGKLRSKESILNAVRV
jgi:Fe-S oxidoreductase